MTPARHLCLLAAISLLAAPVGALELNYGSRVEAIWEDNVFFSSTDEVDDLSFRASPFFDLEDDTGSLQWGFRYSPSYEYFIDQTDLKGWDHDLRGDITYQPRENLSITLRETWQRFGSLARLNQTTETALDDPSAGLEVLNQRRRIKRNVTSVTLNWSPTPRSFTSFNGGYTFWEYAQESRRDQQTLYLSAQYLYGFSERLRAGVTGSWSQQRFDASTTAPRETKTNYYNLSGTIIYQVSPSFEIAFSAGPAQVDGEDPEVAESAIALLRPTISDPVQGASLIDATSCPVEEGFTVLDATCEPGVSISALAGGLGGGALFSELNDVVLVPTFGEAPGGDDDVTYFADVTLTKSWEEWEALLSYQRRDDATSSFGVSSVADVVFGRIRFTPTPRWTFTLSGSWTRRTQEQVLAALVPVVEPRPLQLQFGMLSIPVFPNSAARVGSLVTEVKRDIEFTTIRFVFDARRRISKRLTVYSSLYYTQDESTGDLQITNDTDRFTVRVGVLYEFDPIRFKGF